MVAKKVMTIVKIYDPTFTVLHMKLLVSQGRGRKALGLGHAIAFICLFDVNVRSTVGFWLLPTYCAALASMWRATTT